MNGVIEEDIELDEEVDNSQQAVTTARKVKRIHRSSSGSESSNSNHALEKNLSGPLQVRKNSRKSRDGKGRGLPKKGWPFILLHLSHVSKLVFPSLSVLFSVLKYRFWNVILALYHVVRDRAVYKHTQKILNQTPYVIALTFCLRLFWLKSNPILQVYVKYFVLNLYLR